MVPDAVPIPLLVLLVVSVAGTAVLWVIPATRDDARAMVRFAGLAMLATFLCFTFPLWAPIILILNARD